MFDFDAAPLAIAQEIDGVLVDERDVGQIQNQLPLRRFRVEQHSELPDVCRLDSAAELEHDSTIARSLNFEHAIPRFILHNKRQSHIQNIRLKAQLLASDAMSDFRQLARFRTAQRFLGRWFTS
jgi:hypothetical protein